MQDLPHGSRRNGDAGFRQLAVDAAVSPQRILLRQANDEACGARECWRAAGLGPAENQDYIPKHMHPSPATDNDLPGQYL
jgi:hypothetical protein